MKTFKLERARWWTVPLSILGILSAFVVGFSAQTNRANAQSLVAVSQTVISNYGEELTFSARPEATIFTSATVRISIANREGIYEGNAEHIGNTFSHTVSVDDLNLPPAASLSYVWVFNDGSGQQAESSRETLRYEDTSVPWDWVPTVDGNIVIFTDGSDETTAITALEITRAARSRSAQSLGLAAEATPVSLYVYPDLAAMAGSIRLSGVRVQDWVAAYAIPDQRTAFVAAEAGPDKQYDLEQDISHEVAHLVLAAASGDRDLPAWFDEGFALNAAPQPDIALENILSDAIDERQTLPLDSLCASNFVSLPPQDAALAYAQSGSIYGYIASRYGTSQTKAILDGYREGLSCEAAVQRSLGITLSQLESQWLVDRGRQASQIRSEDKSLVPWLAVWALSVLLAYLFIAPQIRQIRGHVYQPRQ